MQVIYKTKTKEEWVTEVSIHKKVKIIIPFKIKRLFKYLDKKLDTEWAVFLKIDRVEENKIFLSDEFFIPEQEVQYSRVEPLEQPPNGFNVAVHKHPGSMGSFSSEDYENINANSKISLLWCGGKIADAVIHGDVLGIPVWIPRDMIEVEFVDEEFELPEEVMQKFKKKEYSVKTITVTEKDFIWAREPSIEKEPTIKYPYDYIDREYYQWMLLEDAIAEYLTYKNYPDEIDFDDLKKYIEELGAYPDEGEVKRILQWYGYMLDE